MTDLPKEAFLSDFLDKKSNLLDCKNTWEYQGDDGCWRAYTDVANRQIERAFAARDRSCQLTINGAPYTLNFAEMLQINRLSRNGRAIRQIPRVKGCSYLFCHTFQCNCKSIRSQPLWERPTCYSSRSSAKLSRRVLRSTISTFV